MAAAQGSRRERWEMSWKGIVGSQLKGLERHTPEPVLNSVPRKSDFIG